MDTKIYVADKSTFKEQVQRLTGQPPAEAAAVAAPASAPVTGAPRRGRLGVHNLPAFKPTPHRPKLPIIRPEHPRLLAGFASPPSLSPWCSGAGQCVLNMQDELPPPLPSPPSASSTLAEEVVVGETASEEGKPDHMHQLPPVRTGEAKLLNLFPLTPSCSEDR
uniref:VQ domain-containing protein n=1 Tax=Oryza meridionalis TaxID=40149 RepID=A0A0E0F3Z5_9ORYZ